VGFELSLGVERLRWRGGDYGGGGRRRGAGAESGERGAGGKDAKALGHWRSLLGFTGARAASPVAADESLKNAIRSTLIPPGGLPGALIATEDLIQARDGRRRRRYPAKPSPAKPSRIVDETNFTLIAN
jgi:hypothetical protein